MKIWRRGGRHTDRVPFKWELIRDEIAGQIESGVYPRGALLPSIREQMAAYEATAKTIDAAYRALVELGMVEKEPQRGHRVRGESAGSVPAQLAELRAEQARQAEEIAEIRAHVNLPPRPDPA